MDENLSDDNTKERTKGIVRFSESRSKTSDRQRPTRERLSGDMQKHSRSYNSANWRSGKNITEKEKEPRGNDTLHDGGWLRQDRITSITHFLFETAKHAWIVWRDSAIESTSHETWNE